MKFEIKRFANTYKIVAVNQLPHSIYEYVNDRERVIYSNIETKDEAEKLLAELEKKVDSL